MMEATNSMLKLLTLPRKLTGIWFCISLRNTLLEKWGGDVYASPPHGDALVPADMPPITTAPKNRYGDGAGNTSENNSSGFSLI